MSRASRRIKVRIGRASVEVTAGASGAAAQAIADQVAAMLEAIEAAAPRIDSMAFALEAAYRFAAEAEELRQRLAGAEERQAAEQAAETGELLAALDKLAAQLESLGQRFAPERGPAAHGD